MNAPATIADLLRVRAADGPDRTAIIESDGTALTCGQWWTQAEAVAAELLERGVGAGTVVALAMAEDRLGDAAVAWVGTVLSGAVPMLATGLDKRALARGVETVGAEVVVEGIDRPHTADSAEVGLSLRKTRGTTATAAESMPSDTALVLHTSGTTGDPKWVTCSNENLFWGKQIWKARREVNLLCSLSVRDALGILVDALCRAWSVVWHPYFNPVEFVALSARHQVRAASLYGTWATRFTGDEKPSGQGSLENLRTVFISGSPPTPDAIVRLRSVLPRAKVVNLYTQTETWPEGTMSVYDGARPDSIGSPTSGTEVRIEGEGGIELPANEVGDIWLRSARPPRRYLGHEADERKAIQGEWTRTGDRGYVDETGRLHLLDRWRSTIARGLSMVPMAEIEAVLSSYGPIREAAVFPVPDARVGEEIAAAIVADEPIDEDRLLRYLLARLRPQQVPRKLYFIGALPRSRKGTVARHLLRSITTTEVSANDRYIAV